MNLKSAYTLYHGYLAAEVLMECIHGNWNVYRDNYNKMTITDLVWFYTGLHRFVPSQAHYDFRMVSQVLKKVIAEEGVISITELGCWRGYMAESLLKKYCKYDITRYFGYDIDHYAIDTHVVKSSRFHPVKLTKWWHDIADTESTVLLACHTIEHFNDTQLRQILNRCRLSNYKYLVWELPFCQDRGLTSWDGTNNTHLLNLDRSVFQSIVNSFGFEFFYSEKTSEGHLYGMVERSWQ